MAARSRAAPWSSRAQGCTHNSEPTTADRLPVLSQTSESAMDETRTLSIRYLSLYCCGEREFFHAPLNIGRRDFGRLSPGCDESAEWRRGPTSGTLKIEEASGGRPDYRCTGISPASRAGLTSCPDQSDPARSPPADTRRSPRSESQVSFADGSVRQYTGANNTQSMDSPHSDVPCSDLLAIVACLRDDQPGAGTGMASPLSRPRYRNRRARLTPKNWGSISTLWKGGSSLSCERIRVLALRHQ